MIESRNRPSVYFEGFILADVRLADINTADKPTKARLNVPDKPAKLPNFKDMKVRPEVLNKVAQQVKDGSEKEEVE